MADYLFRPLDLSRLTYLVDVLTLRPRLAPPTSSPGSGRKRHCTPIPATPERYMDQPAPSMERMMEQVRRVAALDTTILLGGETGTGKTRLARLIHDLSPRRDSPFLAINCGSLDEPHRERAVRSRQGSLHGPDRDHTGKFAEAGKGTLLLDEIDSLPPALQGKLLPPSRNGSSKPVGSNTALPVRARLIAASNRSLDQEAAASRFRSDLYYRLNVITFTLPPLRDRPQTIPHFAMQFIAEFAARNEREVDGISMEALRAMEDYDWPGNIRELRNVIERAIALSIGREIQLEDLPEQFQPRSLTIATHRA